MFGRAVGRSTVSRPPFPVSVPFFASNWFNDWSAAFLSCLFWRAVYRLTTSRPLFLFLFSFCERLIWWLIAAFLSCLLPFCLGEQSTASWTPYPFLAKCSIRQSIPTGSISFLSSPFLFGRAVGWLTKSQPPFPVSSPFFATDWYSRGGLSFLSFPFFVWESSQTAS